MRNERDGVYERIYRVDEKRREIDISIPADVLLQSNSGVLSPEISSLNYRIISKFERCLGSRGVEKLYQIKTTGYL